MREQLIRYLLGELKPHEHDEVHRQLSASPELRRELAQLRECLAASSQADEFADELPQGLAERVAERVTSDDDDLLVPAAISETADPPVGVLGWSLADLTVAGGVILAVSMLLFPALRDSRDGTRRNVCQNNQRQLWFIVADYAQDHGGYLPRVEPHENAGIFTVKLVDQGYISAEDLSLLLVCPGAPLANQIRQGQYAVQIPTREELNAMSPEEQAVARRDMSPMLAYRFGYFVGPRYRYVRNEPSPYVALFSDAPGNVHEGVNSPNHGGSIVQVTNSDGSIRVLTSSKMPGVEDDFFRNAFGKVAAGVGRHDAVLGPSEATPGVPPGATGQ